MYYLISLLVQLGQYNIFKQIKSQFYLEYINYFIIVYLSEQIILRILKIL